MSSIVKLAICNDKQVISTIKQKISIVVSWHGLHCLYLKSEEIYASNNLLRRRSCKSFVHFSLRGDCLTFACLADDPFYIPCRSYMRFMDTEIASVFNKS